MDNFAEYMVKKQPDSSDHLKRFWIIALTVLLIAATVLLTILFHFPFLLIITSGVIYGAYYLLTGLSVEYEYAVTNGEIDVDKIIARRKRVHLVTADAAKFEAFGPLTDDTPSADERTLVLCADNTGEGEYYADAETDTYGAVRIVFTPSSSVIEALEAHLPRQLRKNRSQGNLS